MVVIIMLYFLLRDNTMQKYLLLILLVIAMPVRAESEEAPKKFKNPIFNDIIYSENYNASHHSKVTPTYIKDLMAGYDEECSYITEDDKAIFLKCHHIDKELSKITYYEMFFARYKEIYKHPKEQKICRVWWCSFHIVNGYITNYYMAAMSSKVANCDDEEEYTIYTKFSCLSELKARGWDKYIPAKLPDDKK